MKRKIISLMLAVCMLVGLLPVWQVGAKATDEIGTCGENLTWTLDEDDTLTISGTGDMYNNYYRFPWNNLNIKKVILTDGVTSIGDYAFSGCDSLTSVSIPNSVTSISRYAFSNCSSLISITIPNSVTNISEGVFNYCSNLKNISIPNSVTNIDGYAFYNCSSLTSISIPNKVTNIGGLAFYECSSLTSLSIPSSVKSIGNWAFSRCTNLTNLSIYNGVSNIGESAFSYCSSLTKLSIPSSVTDISRSAFYNCSSLTSVSIPNSVTYIRDSTFNGCTNLMNVSIPNSVTNIESFAFNDCSSLTDVYYGGSEKKWNRITIGNYNTYLLNATIHYNYNVSPFVDVQDPNSYCYDAVLWAVENGITNGYDETHFAPDRSCTRAQIVTFLWRAAGSPEPSSNNNPFTDVKDGPYYKAILWAVEKGITKGTTATTFAPNAACTRAQIVTFIYRAAGEPQIQNSTNPFTDVKGGAYYKAILWAVENGITKGTTATTFAPNATCTRGQGVTFLYRGRDLLK